MSFEPLSFGKHKIPKIETWQYGDPRKSHANIVKYRRETRKNSKKEKGMIEHAFQLNTRIEQAPNFDSRVTLGQERDELGVPRVNLHWQLTPLDKHSIRKIHLILGQQAGISGIGRIKLKEFLRDEKDDTFPDSINGGWHHMGTTRMANDPKKGVVDSNCQVYGISNLFIAGASCFATSGAPNPTFTLTALSLRLSNYLKDKVL